MRTFPRLNVLIVSLLLFVCSSAVADNDGFGRISDNGMELVYADHTLSGAINEIPVWLEPAKSGFGAELRHRKNGITYLSSLVKTSTGISASIVTQKSGRDYQFDFIVTSVEEKKVTGKVDGKEFIANISSESMDGNHFVSPSVNLTIDGVDRSFRINGGNACMGCLVKILFGVVSISVLSDQ